MRDMRVRVPLSQGDWLFLQHLAARHKITMGKMLAQLARPELQRAQARQKRDKGSTAK
jgi:hypothetical protein